MNDSYSFSILRLAMSASLLLACSDSSNISSPRADISVSDSGVYDAFPDTQDQNIESDLALDTSIEVDSYLTGDPCQPVVPPAAMLKPGVQQDGARLTVNGRVVGQLGTAQSLEGFPSNILPHPVAPVVYVTSTSHDDRLLVVLNKDTLEPLQTLMPEDVYAGLALDVVNQKLYVSGGESSLILIYDIDADGLLILNSTLTGAGHVAYLSLDSATNTLWFSQWDDAVVHRIDIESNTISRTIELPSPGWQFTVTDRRLWVSMLAHPELYSINLDDPDSVDALSMIGAVADLCALDGHMYVVIPDTDAVGRFELSDASTFEFVPVGLELVNSEGIPLANTNANSIVCDPTEGRIYVSRGADNLISVFDSNGFNDIGLIPTGEYPTKLAHDANTNVLWLSEGKGGTGPSEGRTGKRVISGFARTLNLNSVDLAEATVTAARNFVHPKTVFPFECDGFFPVPSRPNQRSPIEHLILIVKENKTFDCVFGDLDPSRADVDPELVVFGRNVTPNLHALADQFSLSDNFYTEVEDSDIGHVILTAAHLTEYVQRIWIEKDHSRHIGEGYQVSGPSIPKVGNFFTHLMNHDVSLKIMGEVVGLNARAKGNRGVAGQHIDLRFPGGGFVNYTVKDEVKARHLAQVIEAGQLQAFTYILLPNDHTLGTRSGAPTPESMVADNDYAVGIIIEALSKSPYWMKSAAIILQDDPQGCRDHVDVHRSPLLIVSPWANREYMSHTRASFMSVFATIEHIFGIPPMGRGDASASPLWDMFTANADPREFEAIPRQVPEAFNQSDEVGGILSHRMDFRGPDRNPSLGPVLEAYMAHRAGRISRQEADAQLLSMRMNLERWLVTMEESVEEVFSFDEGIEAYHEYLDNAGVEAPRYPADGFNLGPNYP